MDDRRFDALTRRLATASNRRQLLKGLLGIGGAIAVASPAGVGAARRPPRTPKPATCPGEQTWSDGECRCPTGKTQCGPDCCPPGVSECCDNACCFGTCYGEELCCPRGSIVCDGQCRDWECCSDSDCAPGSNCNPDTHICQCAPDCTGKNCGSDGCGAQCGICPEGQSCRDGVCACTSGFLCADNACHECCEVSDCVTARGGVAECWHCTSGQCNYLADFCTGGVCGISSYDVVGHCLECGVSGPLTTDGCNAAVPCCSGYTCDFSFGADGFCQVTP